MEEVYYQITWKSKPHSETYEPYNDRTCRKEREKQNNVASKGGATLGQKVNPIGFRVGTTRTWSSVWYSDRNYGKWLHEDLAIHDRIKKEFYAAGIADIRIERSGSKIKVMLYAAKPGIIVGKQGAGIERIKQVIAQVARDAQEIFVQPEEVKKPETDAQLIAESIAEQIEKRAHFRRAMKRAMSNAIKSGVEGIKVQVAGRLGGNEIARTERYQEGRTPLHTLRADITYGYAIARTTYGVIGVKVWVYRGEVAKRADIRRKSVKKG